MNKSEILKAAECAVKGGYAWQLFEKEMYSEALGIVEQALSDSSIPESHRTHLAYIRAVLWDSMGRSEEALIEFAALRKISNLPSIYNSFIIAASNLEKLCNKLIAQDPENPKLRYYFDLLERTNYAPWSLRLAVARQEGNRGKLTVAKEMIDPLVDLAPNDPDYLRGALEIAVLISDKAWQTKIFSKIKDLSELKPYNAEYLKLLTLEPSDQESS